MIITLMSVFRLFVNEICKKAQRKFWASILTTYFSLSIFLFFYVGCMFPWCFFFGGLFSLLYYPKLSVLFGIPMFVIFYLVSCLFVWGYDKTKKEN